MKFSSALPCRSVSAYSVSLRLAILFPRLPKLPAPRPITIDDYFQIQTVHEPQLSPDAQWVAYTVDKSSLKTDKNESRIWMISASGGEPLAMTAEGVSSSHPRWSPDGKLPRLPLRT